MADNRQFTDHNEIGGVNVYLEDKKLAESPEQNTVATTDYVLLKDTDGVPHKISKANMMSVVKDALADLLKNNDLGTSVTNVPALNASAFGSATVANLASVLGVWTIKDYTQVSAVTSPDDLIGRGLCAKQFNGIGDGILGYWLVFSFSINAETCLQFAIPVLGSYDQKIYTRQRSTGTGGAWHSWVAIY